MMFADSDPLPGENCYRPANPMHPRHRAASDISASAIKSAGTLHITSMEMNYENHTHHGQFKKANGEPAHTASPTMVSIEIIKHHLNKLQGASRSCSLK